VIQLIERSAHIHECAFSLRIIQVAKDPFYLNRWLRFVCVSYFSSICNSSAWVRLKWFTVVSAFEVPQKQTVPVAPRTRISPEESHLEVIHLQSRLPALCSQLQVEEPKEQAVEGIQGHLIIFFNNLFQRMSFCSRLSREKRCLIFKSSSRVACGNDLKTKKLFES